MAKRYVLALLIFSVFVTLPLDPSDWRDIRIITQDGSRSAISATSGRSLTFSATGMGIGDRRNCRRPRSDDKWRVKVFGQCVRPRRQLGGNVCAGPYDEDSCTSRFRVGRRQGATTLYARHAGARPSFEAGHSKRNL
jgi:hypothetical protein